MSPERKGFDLGDYVEVKDRIKVFYELFGQGRLVTDEVTMLTAPDGKQRVMVRAKAYRTPDDPLPGVGYSWMELPGTTPYTKGSEVENAETSAWGRAIGSLGILIDRSIASANEIQNKSAQDTKPDKPSSVVQAEGGLIGIASLGKVNAVDGELRETPDGMSVGFVLGEGREKLQVVAYGVLAQVLHPLIPEIVGKRVQVFGPVEADTMRVANRDVPFQRVTLERIVTTEWTLPAVEPAAEPPTVPMFDDADESALAKAGV